MVSEHETASYILCMRVIDRCRRHLHISESTGDKGEGEGEGEMALVSATLPTELSSVFSLVCAWLRVKATY